MWLLTVFLRVGLFIASPVPRATVCVSLLRASFHLVFGRLFVFLGISVISSLVTLCSPSVIITCPDHTSRVSVIFYDVCVTLGSPLICLFFILSFFISQHIHLSILISFVNGSVTCYHWCSVVKLAVLIIVGSEN